MSCLVICHLSPLRQELNMELSWWPEIPVFWSVSLPQQWSYSKACAQTQALTFVQQVLLPAELSPHCHNWQVLKVNR